MRTDVKTLALVLILSLSLSSVAYGYTVASSSYTYKRDTVNTPDNSLVFPFVDEDPDGDSSLSTYYGQNGSIYYNNDSDFAFANSSSQRFGASTFIDGAKNQQVTETAPSGLVAYYPLDNANAKDISGNGNDGTLNGGVTTGVTGQVSKAYDFDGVDDYIYLGEPPDFYDENLEPDFTVCGWVNVDTTASESRIVAHGSSSYNDNFFVRIESGLWDYYVDQSGGTIDLYVDASTSYSNPNADQWYFFCIVISGADLADATGSPWQIGSSRGRETDGTIDDVRIYDRALSSSEVQALYDAEKPTTGNDPTFGSEQTANAAPLISINDPTSKTYETNSIPVDVNTSDPDGDNYACNISDDGSVIGTTNEASQTYTDSLTKTDGNHNLTVNCDDGSVTSSDSVYYTVDTTPPSVSLIRPDGNESKYNIPLNYTASDATSSIDSCWYSVDNEANQTLPACSNSSFNRTNVGGHTLSLWVNDTVGLVTQKTKNYTAYYINTFQAEDANTGSSITDFEVTFTNGTASYNVGGSTSDGTFEVNTSDLPYGDVNVTYKAGGYNTETFDLGTVNASSDFDNKTYQLEKASFSMQVYDEESENPIKANLTFSNSTQNYDLLTTGFDQNSQYQASGYENQIKCYNDPIFYYFNEDVLADKVKLNVSDFQYLDNIVIKVSKPDGSVSQYLEPPATGIVTFDINKTVVDEQIEVCVDSDGSTNSHTINTESARLVQENATLAVDYSYLSQFMPTGDVTATVDNNLYKPRQYKVTLDQYSKATLDAYLLKSTQAVTQSIVVIDEQGTGVSDATITIQKNIDGNWKTISQKESTGSGTNFFLNPATQYKVIVSKTGYIQATDKFYPSNYDELTIQLASVSEFDFTTLWDSISYKLEPLGNVIPPAYQTFNFTVYDDKAILGEIGLKLFDGNDTLLNETSVTGSPSGATVSVAYNLSDFTYSDEVAATWYFERNGSIYNQTRIYTISGSMEPGNRSIIGILNDMGSTTSNAAKGIVALFITLAIATALGSRLKGLGGGIIVLLSIGFFTLIGWMGLPIFMVTLLGIVGVYLARG